MADATSLYRPGCAIAQRILARSQQYTDPESEAGRISRRHLDDAAAAITAQESQDEQVARLRRTADVLHGLGLRNPGAESYWAAHRAVFFAAEILASV